MAVAAAPKRRGGLRLLVFLVVLVLIVGGALFWLNTAAQASVNVPATLTVFTKGTSVAHGSGAYSPAATGSVVNPGDSIKTDASGRAAIQFPDGSITRLANSTEITLTSAHFNHDGTVHDISIKETLGRTLSSVQHLVAGSTFQVTGNSTTASVRGTEFEVVVTPGGGVLIKLFEGTLDFNGVNAVHLTAGQQATADNQGNVKLDGDIAPEKGDPFVPEMKAEAAVNSNKTDPGSEQTQTGPPIHDGEKQQYGYDYAGGGDAEFAVGYPGSVMGLQVTLPNGTLLPADGPSVGNPAVVEVIDAPAGHYILTVWGISGLGADGESPTIAAAGKEPCKQTNIDANGVIRRGWTEAELAGAVHVPGLNGLSVHIIGKSLAGAIISGNATFSGILVTALGVVYAHDGGLGVIPVAATFAGLNIPAGTAAGQISSAANIDLSTINVGYVVDRVFTCPGILMIDGHHSK